MNCVVSSFILVAASQSVPISQNQKKQINVPWWNDKCSEAIKDRNRAGIELFKKFFLKTCVEH